MASNDFFRLENGELKVIRWLLKMVKVVTMVINDGYEEGIPLSGNPCLHWFSSVFCGECSCVVIPRHGVATISVRRLAAIQSTGPSPCCDAMRGSV